VLGILGPSSWTRQVSPWNALAPPWRVRVVLLSRALGWAACVRRGLWEAGARAAAGGGSAETLEGLGGGARGRTRRRGGKRKGEGEGEGGGGGEGPVVPRFEGLRSGVPVVTQSQRLLMLLSNAGFHALRGRAAARAEVPLPLGGLQVRALPLEGGTL